MITGNQICLGILAAGTYYVQVPIACQIGTVRATVQEGAVGTPSNVVIKDNTDVVTIGTATFDSGAEAEEADYVPSVATPLSTYANRDLAKDEVIQVVVTLASAGDGISVQIELDPYALS